MDTNLAVQAYVPEIHPTGIIPYLLLLLGGIACLVVDAASGKEGSRRYLPWIAGGTLLAAMACFFLRLVPGEPFLENTFRADAFGQLASLAILSATFVMTTMGPSLVRRRNLPSGEFYTLILFASLGMVLLSVSNELLTAFIALEMFALSLYVLVGIDRRSSKSAEACFKYFILGAFASAFLVFGIAFLYGATHTTFLTEMAEAFRTGYVESIGPGGEVAQVPINAMYVYAGFALMFVGICFKLSLAPFHMWAPDVYEGGNIPAVMVVATASKVATFAFLIHLVEALSYWEGFAGGAVYIITGVAVVSMLWGNIAALAQTHFRRMMALSSVAHSGYMTVGVLVLVALPGMMSGSELEAGQLLVRQAVILYMAGYTVMNVLAFGVAHYVGGGGHMAAYRGLVYRRPLPAIGMAIAMFSLVGIGFTPPTIGFMGKFYIFKEAVQVGFIGLAVVAVLASVISAFYYLSLVVTMFMREEERVAHVPLAGTPEAPVQVGGEVLTRMVLVTASILIFVFGIFPQLFIGLGETLVNGTVR